MDTHISNDNNNPINWNGNNSNDCECCGIEENKTYFIENTSICEDCFEEEEKKNQNNLVIKKKSVCLQHQFKTIKKMKKTILTTLTALVLLTSCSKEDDLKPISCTPVGCGTVIDMIQPNVHYIDSNGVLLEDPSSYFGVYHGRYETTLTVENESTTFNLIKILDIYQLDTIVGTYICE